jgi:NAD(P)H dehydrogenase (quinone)
MIVVTGATGLLGGAVVERLLGKVPAAEIGVSVRDPAKATALAERGVRVRRGDYDDAASLAHAFEGAEQLLLVSAAATGEPALRQHATAIDAARAAGVRRIVYTSHMGANPASAFAPMPDHAATEALLEASGLAFTALRNGFYASSGRMLLGQAFETGELAAPADGPVSWTAHDDLAEAAAIVLTDEGRFEGPTPPLTGSAALDLAALAAEVLGRPIRRTVLTDAQYREALPEPVAEMLLMGLFAASRAGEFAAVDPTLGELLGRPPLTVRDVLAKD